MEGSIQLEAASQSLPVKGNVSVTSRLPLGEPTLFQEENSGNFHGRHLEPWQVKEYFRTLADGIPFNVDIMASNVCGLGEMMTQFAYGSHVITLSVIEMKGGVL